MDSAVLPNNPAPALAQVLAPSIPEVLFSEHEGLVDTVAAGLLARRRITTMEREDVLQEGRLGLLQAGRRYDPARGSFEPFARRCILSAILSALREAGEPSSTCSLSPGDVDTLTEPSHEDAAEARVALQQLLPQLPERERQAIDLHHLQGYSKRMVGIFLDVSERHAARILDDALSHLQVLAGA